MKFYVLKKRFEENTANVKLWQGGGGAREGVQNKQVLRILSSVGVFVCFDPSKENSTELGVGGGGSGEEV